MTNDGILFQTGYSANNLLQITFFIENRNGFPAANAFITCVPGVNTNTGRSYDYNAKLTLKTSAFKILSLAEAIDGLIDRGKNFPIGFSIFADPSKSSFNANAQNLAIKSIGIDLSTNNKTNIPQLVIFCNQQNIFNKSVFMSLPEAKAFAHVLRKLATRAIEFESAEAAKAISNKQQMQQ